MTPELKEMLDNCPYCVGYTCNKIRWSKKIYEAFCREYDKGIMGTDILRSFGIDPDLLGEKRAGAFRKYYARKREKEGAPVVDRRKRNVRPSNYKNYTKRTPLEQEVAYLEQEVDFLKKILLIENPDLKH